MNIISNETTTAMTRPSRRRAACGIASAVANAILALIVAGQFITPALTFAQEPSKVKGTFPQDPRFIQAKTGSDFRSNTRLQTYGDEAFTEPIESIKLAASEFGIVAKVNVKRGDVVLANDLLLELDMSVLEASRRLALSKANSKARLTAAEVEFEAKTKRYNKRVDLLRDKAGSPEEVEKAKTEVELAQQAIEVIKEEAEQFALETKRIESQMEQRRTRSPINGVVIDVLRKPGEYVSSNDPHIITIVKLDTLKVVFHLPTAQASKVVAGQTARMLMTESNDKAEGVVQYVAPVTNADSGRVRVEILIDNKSYQYRSGVRCRILDTMSQQSMRSNPGKMMGPLTRVTKTR